MKRHLLLILAVALLALGAIALTLGATTAVRQDDSCQLTSQAVLRSCRLGAQSDLWLALGKCNNVLDPAERTACKQKASDDLTDALRTCNEQNSARQAVCQGLGEEPYDPVIEPADFVDEIDNPYFPLKPGTTFFYEGQTAEGLQRDEFFVTRNTRVILGVTCVEVRDRVTVNGEVIEDTLDWFAQDRDGNVWYFGENAKQLADGLIVGVEGSWTGGVDGAKPGIIMKARPIIGDFYRQEFSLDTAEDVARVLRLNESVTVPAGSFHHCLKTEDTSPLEPGVVDNKFYAPEVGFVLSIDPSSGEKLKLVRITRK